MIALVSDKLITDEKALIEKTIDASIFLDKHKEAIIKLAMNLDRPETVYRCIKKIRIKIKSIIVRFVENPNLSKAIEYLNE